MWLTDMRHIFRSPSQPGNNQKVLGVSDQFRYHLTAVEHTGLTAPGRASNTENVTRHDVSSHCTWLDADQTGEIDTPKYLYATSTHSLKSLGTDQTLRQYHRHRLSSLIDHGTGRLERRRDFRRLLNPHADEAARLEDWLYCLPHRHLPGIALPEISTHADED